MTAQLITPALSDPQLHLWTREEYHRIGALGLFDGKRVQLIQGQVIEMSPMKSRHATGILRAIRALEKNLPEGMHLRPQLPLALGDQSEPEPDVAVITGSLEDYEKQHPTTALLVVEVSDTTLTFDQTVKAALYAQSGIPEYWILNLVEACVEIYRSPYAPTSPEGAYYQEKQILGRAESTSLVLAPEISVAVADLLP